MMRELTIEEIEFVSGGDGATAPLSPSTSPPPLKPYASFGGGVFGSVAGFFYSQDTGWGFYFGVGTPGPSFNFGLTNNTEAVLVGPGGSAQFTPVNGIATGVPFNPSGIQFGNPGIDATYGVTFDQVARSFSDTVNDWLNKSSIGQTFERISDPGSNRSHDPSPFGGIGLNTYDPQQNNSHRHFHHVYDRGWSPFLQSASSVIVLGANHQEPRHSPDTRFAHM